MHDCGICYDRGLLINKTINSFSHCAIVYSTHYAESTTREDDGTYLQRCVAIRTIQPLNRITNQALMQKIRSITFQCSCQGKNISLCPTGAPVLFTLITGIENKKKETEGSKSKRNVT